MPYGREVKVDSACLHQVLGLQDFQHVWENYFSNYGDKKGNINFDSKYKVNADQNMKLYYHYIKLLKKFKKEKMSWILWRTNIGQFLNFYICCDFFSHSLYMWNLKRFFPPKKIHRRPACKLRRRTFRLSLLRPHYIPSSPGTWRKSQNTAEAIWWFHV